MSLFKLADVFSNRSLCIVPLVAKTPILFVLVTKLAGFIAGSIPIKGMVYLSLRTLIAFVVAVLHATTIILAF